MAKTGPRDDIKLIPMTRLEAQTFLHHLLTARMLVVNQLRAVRRSRSLTQADRTRLADSLALSLGNMRALSDRIAGQFGLYVSEVNG